MRTIQFCCVLMLACFVGSAAGAEYGVVNTLRVGGAGGWDLVAVDSQAHRLYIPRGTHTMVLDETTGKVLGDIPGQKRAHGVAIVPGLNRGFITDGRDGSVVIFDLKTYKILGKVKADADADDIHYDPASGRVLVVCGDPGVMVPIQPDVNPKTGSAGAALDLGGKPEGFAVDGHGKAYVAIENKDSIAVVDTRAMKVVAHWPVAPGGAPVGMAMDAQNGHLFISCRRPEKMIVMDAKDGKVLADLPIGAGTDGATFDNGEGFASCRDGSLTIVKETSAGKFEVAQTVRTAPGARTVGVDHATHKLYLPTAEFKRTMARQRRRRRPAMKPGSFKILVVGPEAAK